MGAQCRRPDGSHHARGRGLCDREDRVLPRQLGSSDPAGDGCRIGARTGHRAVGAPAGRGGAPSSVAAPQTPRGSAWPRPDDEPDVEERLLTPVFEQDDLAALGGEVHRVVLGSRLLDEDQAGSLGWLDLPDAVSRAPSPAAAGPGGARGRTHCAPWPSRARDAGLRRLHAAPGFPCRGRPRAPGLTIAIGEFATLGAPGELFWPRGIHVSRSSVPALALLADAEAVTSRPGGGPAAAHGSQGGLKHD